ncbi:hypothetical protein K493DRAFT_23523 [Basidiobolus meristosporus CBS 931.73]|uniref:RING-type E3 ubiquitin transferase n=1 Tax=Basidiobolus meristosporus CBS 931.73 TaxID=1314790 RepID=A0A1Y1Z7T1_9FUNG|nr:hypothetical protein K493DRAFT_23523 [Basidiobolus meristosporus CBS 931.73]|eukprot:ORY06322.1 hypothetical protein K493DRAFT_23523 [Basidiobolus meristosporus CBS 931.73]
MDIALTSVVSALFYYGYRVSLDRIASIVSAKPLEEAVPGDYVRIEGKVALLQDKIEVENSSGKIIGVIQETTVDRVFSRWDNLFLRWVTESENIDNAIRGVSFRIINKIPHGLSINVPEFDVELLASKLSLEPLNTQFQPTLANSFGQSAMEYLQGEKPIGIQTTHKILPVGSSLTVLGQLSAQSSSNDMILDLVPPDDPKLPFILTRESFKKFLHGQANTARIFWWISMTSAAILGLLIGRRAYPYIVSKYKSWSERMMLRKIVKARKGTISSEYDPEMCIICLTKKRDTILQDCGHFHTCAQCTLEIRDCPLCRAPIRTSLKVYY